jgi:hypothetical protein
LSGVEYQAIYQPPSLDLLAYIPDDGNETDETTLRANAHLLEESCPTLIFALAWPRFIRPVITANELELAQGIKVSRSFPWRMTWPWRCAPSAFASLHPFRAKQQSAIELPNANQAMGLSKGNPRFA